ncbi:MAG: hypothetical protein ACW97Z_06965 [Candidatus Hodarchaeales archaeon]|jgi:hypothetical protein
MSKIDSTAEKLLERPITREIMKHLVDNDLSIPQIAKKMKSFDIQTIIAFFAELQRFGLIELTDHHSKKTEVKEEAVSLTVAEYEITNAKSSLFPPLGISVMEYNRLWENISGDNTQINLQELENSTFTIPSSLKHLFKDEQSNKVK